MVKFYQVLIYCSIAITLVSAHFGVLLPVFVWGAFLLLLLLIDLFKKLSFEFLKKGYQLLRKNLKLIVIITLVYSVFFSYAQQTLLIDDVSYTQYGLFHLVLPSGLSYVISFVPPVPESSMPFPLWGPFVSITTNYFDFAATPLSIAITLLVSFLVSLNFTLYLELYKSVKSAVAEGRMVSVASTATLFSTALACSCELFTGLLAAVEPESVALGVLSFITQINIAFLVLAILLLLSGFFAISYRLYYDHPPKMESVKQNALPLITLVPFLFVLLLGGSLGLYLSLITAALIALSIPLDKKTGFVILGFSLPSLLLKASLAPVSVLLGVVGAFSKGVRTLKHYALAQVVLWTIIMLGPISLIFPRILVPPNASSEQLEETIEFFVYLWLIATPFAISYNLATLFSLTQNTLKQVTVKKAKINEGYVYLGLGALFVISQIFIFLANPAVFLTTNIFANPKEQFTLSFGSLVVVLIGVSLIAIGVDTFLCNTQNSTLLAIRRVVKTKRKKAVFLTALVGYFALSMYLSGEIVVAKSDVLAPGITTPSYALFVSGAPPTFVPSLTLYFSKRVGLILVPLYALIQLISAYLFALNIKVFSLVRARFAKSPLLLSVAPLFAACPLCAAVSIYSILGIGALNTTLAIGAFLTNSWVRYLLLGSSWFGEVVSIAYFSRKTVEVRTS
jgi:hypothetical protein